MSVRIRNIQFATISRFLKLGKSEPKNEAPYTLESVRGADYWELTNRHGETVGQMTRAQVQRAIQ